MEIFYIGTDPKCQERGIGQEITEKSLEVARGLRARKLKQICMADKIVNEHVQPEVAFAVAASTFSQRIMEKLNFETLVEVRYEDYIRDGKKMSDRIGNVHKTAKLTVRKLWRFGFHSTNVVIRFYIKIKTLVFSLKFALKKGKNCILIKKV